MVIKGKRETLNNGSKAMHPTGSALSGMENLHDSESLKASFIAASPLTP